MRNVVNHILGVDTGLLSKCSNPEIKSLSLTSMLILIVSMTIAFITWHASQYISEAGIILRLILSVLFANLYILWCTFVFVNWKYDPRYLAESPLQWVSIAHAFSYMILTIGFIIYALAVVVLVDLYFFEGPVNIMIETLANAEDADKMLKALGFATDKKDLVLGGSLATRIQLTQNVMGFSSIIWHGLFSTLVIIPVALIFMVKAKSDHQYHVQQHKQERLIIEAAYSEAEEFITQLFLEAYDKHIPFYSRYTDPPFNTIEKRTSHE